MRCHVTFQGLTRFVGVLHEFYHLKCCSNITHFDRVCQTLDLVADCEDAEIKDDDDEEEDLLRCRELKQ